ncbi:MAG: hypothetical protein H6P96_1030 [Candidatus Aminicenantes bacterium]|nr:hypothetical protein [Candidatus Aminicenantes bacterium]
MKRSPLVTVLSVLALAALALSLSAQTEKKPDIAGTWTGFAMADGARLDITVVFARNETGYAGKLSDASGMVPESPLREIVFKDGKLGCEFDLDMGGTATLIRFELALENDILKGLWFDPDGNSDTIELTLQK